MELRVRAGWMLTAAVLAGSLARCNCQDTGGPPCAIDADCPDGMVCVDGTCRTQGEADGEDGRTDDGSTRPDRGDLGAYDGGGWVECDGPADCAGDQVCFNGLCVTVIPDPACVTGDQDSCINDTYCEPDLEGCVPWEAHPDPLPDCEHIPPEGEFTPVEEWVWDSPVAAPEWNEVMMTPVVADLSGRAGGDVFSVPAVIFNSFRRDRGYTQDGVLRAVDGATGEPLFSITEPEHFTHPVSNIAVGDIDADGLPEIVTGKSGGQDLICFEEDGSFKWVTDPPGQFVVGWGGPAIANVDGEGLPEIVLGAAVIDADGAIRWHHTGSSGDNSTPMTAAAPFSVPVDVDDDGLMEIVTGDVLYDHAGNPIWDTGYGDGFVAVANFLGEDIPEIVVVSRGSVRVQSSINGELLWLATEERLNGLPECQPNCGLLGPPTVADFDGDDLPEIGVAGADVYIVLDTTGDVLWSVPTRDGSSNITGSAVFDFEGDRRAEVVYADEVSLKVYKGSDGTVQYEQPHSSLTACEYPVVADVDSDHNAEIVIAQNTLMEDAPHKFAGVRVFGDRQDNWVDTRRIWNQHAYHVTNVEENGGVPADPEENWMVDGLNNFRQNVQGGGLFNAPDLTVRGLGFVAGGCATGGIVIYVEVFNRGAQDVPPGVPVSFYRDDPRQGGTLLGTVHTTRHLRPGRSEQLSFLWEDPPFNQPCNIWVAADDQGWDQAANAPDGIHSECREHNNLGLIEDVLCRPET